MKHGAECLIHLGDVGTMEVIDALCVASPGDQSQLPAHVVFGNTDWDLDALWDYASDLDVAVDHPVGRIQLDDGELIYCHGHEPAPMQEAIDRGVRYLCHGHTHRRADDHRGATRVINPGALFRAGAYTVALLDTSSDSLDFYELSG